MNARQFIFLLAGVSTGGLAGIILTAQDDPASAQRFRTRATAVEVDVIVRDSRGRPVTGLAAEDFEIYEDGVRQTVTSFEAPVARSGAAGDDVVTSRTPTAEEAAGARALNAVALVFDRLGPDGRALASKASEMYVAEARRPEDFVGVFGIDLSLTVLQPYTNDPALLSAAVQQAATRATAVHPRLQDEHATTSQVLSAVPDETGGVLTYKTAPPTGVASAESPGVESVAPGQTIASNPADIQLLEMMRRMERSYEMLTRDQRGYATTSGLQAVVESLAPLPGRKTLVFFSEGLALPPDVLARFQSVIAAANRANVSVYAIDAAGLRTRSATSETRRELQQAMAEIDRNLERGIMTRGLERSEDVLRHDPAAGLGLLAAGTGGLLIDNTNDLRSGLQRIDADQRSYYLLSYAPSNAALDGRFRRIEVKVGRPGLRVEARRGYLAVEDSGMPLLAYEAPAAVLLDTSPVPNGFPVSARAFSFPDPRRPGLSPIVVELSTSSLSYATDEGKRTFRAEVVVLARIKDGQGQVLQKMSQRYELEGPLAQIEASRAGEILFYREPELPPGAYTVETIVYDSLSGHASARIGSLDVPATGPETLDVSSLLVVRRAERLPEAERNPDHPLQHGDLLLYPNLGEPLRKSSDQAVSFYFAVQPPMETGDPDAVLELVQGDRALAQLPLPLDPPDASGRIRQVSSVPLEPIPPGTYELRVRVNAGGRSAVRQTTVRIEP